jgi:hypothetical protein
MKLPIILSAILLTLGWITNSSAQLITSQNFGSTSSPGSYTSSVTLTTSGPLILQLGVEFNTDTDEGHQPPSAPNITVQIDQQSPITVTAEGYVVTQHPTDPNNGQVYSTDISSINYTTGVLAAGSHTVKFTFPSYFDTGAGIASNLPIISGGYTIIAPNEPPTGLATAEAGLQSSINTIQADEATDASEISILQANQATNASAIAALQTLEANDAAVISTLQSQLATVQTTLQGEINNNSAAITALQNRATADESTAAQQQTEITALQNQTNGDPAAIATLQQQQAATAAQQQTDEANLATLQSQQATIQTTLQNLTTQLANDEAAQAQENTTLQNQITALQNGSSSLAGLQSQINSLNKSKNFTQTLTYAGVGLGLAGIGTGIGAILSDDSGSDASTNPSSPDDSTDSNPSRENAR